MILNKAGSIKIETQILDHIINGSIFIYPTDTIYGLGCDASNNSAVLKIREIKKRIKNPFSIIAPSFNWIKSNCQTTKEQEQEIRKKLPGPYTFFLNLKDHNCIATQINPEGQNKTLGVRIPSHWFTKIIQKTGKPFVTTSVNISGQPFMKKIEDLDIAIRDKVDIIIYDGPSNGNESIKIDFR